MAAGDRAPARRGVYAAVRTMPKKPRYRTEDGVLCVDMRLRSAAQLFDGRDPAPFRERDLDDDAVAYLVSAVQELPRRAPFKIVVSISAAPDPGVSSEAVVEAVRAQFEHETHMIEGSMRKQLRRGQLSLFVGLTVLVVFLSLAELAQGIGNLHIRGIVREGLVITGWVAMWRPLDVLLYDWWPLSDERTLHRRIASATVDVRYEPG